MLNFIRAGHHHHDDATVLAFLDSSSELRPFRPQLLHRRVDVIAHERHHVRARMLIFLTLVNGIRWVHAHFARAGVKDEPVIFLPLLGHILPAEHVSKKCARCLRIVGVNQGMN